MERKMESEEVKLLKQLWDLASRRYRHSRTFRNHLRVQRAGRAVIAQIEMEGREVPGAGRQVSGRS